MTHQLFQLPKSHPLTLAGIVLPGAKAYFYLTTTITPTDVYTTSARNVAHAVPVVADIGGRFPPIYLDPAVQYKATITDSNDVLLYTVDPVNDQVLSQAVIGAYLYPRTAGETSAGVTPTNYARAPGDPRRFGASLVASNAANLIAIQAAMDSNPRVPLFEVYTIEADVVLRSNRVFDMREGGGLILANGITTEVMVSGDTLTNVTILGGSITGNGAAGFSNIRLDDCTGVLIDNVASTKAGSMGVQLEGCINAKIINCDLSNNYFYGVSDRDGIGNRRWNNRYAENGITGVATSTGGRGVNLWRCIDCKDEGGRYVANTEYGYRIYSELADVDPSYGNECVNGYFEDNVRADIVLYDESVAGTLVIENIVSKCIIVRATDPALDCSVLLDGSDNHVDNVHVYKNGAFGNFVAFAYFNCTRNKVTNCSASRVRDMFAFTTVTDCIVDNCEGHEVGTVSGATAGIVGSGQIIRDSQFTHGGVGAADIGIITYNATGKSFLENVRLDGFDYGIYINNEALSIKGCKTTNSTTAGFRKDGTVLSTQEFFGNSWDSANPAVLQNFDLLEGRPATVWYTSAPASLTWERGATWIQTASSAAGVPGGMCVTSGTFSAATDNTGDTDGSTAVITGMADTSDFFAGEYVSVSAGFASTGPFKIISKTASTITVDTNSNSAQSNVTVSTPDPVFKDHGVLAA